MKLYICGEWTEVIIDDYIPCYKSTRMPIFANSDKQELGWIVIQKGIFYLSSFKLITM